MVVPHLQQQHRARQSAKSSVVRSSSTQRLTAKHHGSCEHTAVPPRPLPTNKPAAVSTSKNVDPTKPLPSNIIPKARPENIPEDGLIIINGRKASGKTFMCHWLLAMMAHKYDAGMFISDSIHTILQWRKNIPRSFIFKGFEMAQVENWIEVVKARNDKRVERGLPMRKYLLVLDDIGYDSKMINSKPMIRLIQNARQVGVSVWIITQYLYQLNQQLREAADFAICFRENNAKQLKKIKDDVFFVLGKDFDAVFKAATGRSRKQKPGEEKKDYDRACPPRAICINNRISGGVEDWRDCVSCIYADYRDVEKPWRLANPVHYLLDEMTYVNDAERRSKEDAMKSAYARSEVGLQVYNNDFIDKVKTKTVFLLEDDYFNQLEGSDTNPPSTVNGE